MKSLEKTKDELDKAKEIFKFSFFIVFIFFKKI